MPRRLALTLILLVSMMPSARLVADQPAAATKTGPAVAEFKKVFAEWKDLMVEMGTMRAKYRTASTEERAEFDKQWVQLVAKGDAMLPQLFQAAEKAYVEAPNADSQITDLLLAITARCVRTDDYDEALRLSTLLIKNECPDKRVTDMAGVSAFAVGDFDAAEKYLTQAKSEGSLGDLGERFLLSFPKIKKAWAKEQQLRDAEAKADDLPRVLLTTNKGDIELELFENEAPNTVANFISLVEKKFYDGLTFHRVLPAFMAQGGDPEGTGGGGPGYTIPDECHQPNHRLHFRGSLSMAKTAAPDSGGSQFFITFLPVSHLDGVHTVFGRVIKGIEVLSKLQRRDSEKPDPPKPDKIVEAKVLRKRPHEYVPKTLPGK